MKMKRIALAMAVAALSAQAQASGFQLFEQSGSGQGRAFAGMGAASDDASVQWYNAAGLTAIDGHQVVVGAHYISPRAKFRDAGSTVAAVQPGPESDGGQSAVVPNLFWKGRWGSYDLGLSVVAPFGLETRYEGNWLGRGAGVKSELKTININPSVARKVGSWSFGAGISAQYLDVTLTRHGYVSSATDAEVRLSGDSWAWGYNVGVQWQPTDKDVIGVSYRSTMDHKARGNATVTVLATGTVASDQRVSAKVTLPAVVDLSWRHDYSDRLSVLASATWTGWSSFKELRVVNGSGATIALTPENWHDTWRLALGANWRISSKWLVRGGFAYDQTPVRDAYRTVRIPDNDRRWLSLGLRYDVSPAVKLDAAYTHVFTDITPIDERVYAANGTTYIGNLTGSYDSSVDIFSLQLVWNY